MAVFSRLCLAGALLLAAPAASAETFTFTGAQAQVISVTTVHERAADWVGGKLNGLRLEGDSLIAAGERGMYTSPVLSLPPFDEVVPSWNVQTSGEGYAVLKVRVQVGGKWSDWFSFGRWSRENDRYSLREQANLFGRVHTDVLRLSRPATALQYHLSLVGAGTRASLVGLTTTDLSRQMAGLGAPGNPAVWGTVLNVPPRSQMLYPNGGAEWCSPTSVSMILAAQGTNIAVPAAASGVYDRVYGGAGNWAFNAAFAGELGHRALLARLPSLAAAEPYIAAGQPLAVSLGWKRGELSGAALPSSSGHLMVLVGFDAEGNPVLNDPAAPNDAGVRRTYNRAQFERLWLRHSGGLAYVISHR